MIEMDEITVIVYHDKMPFSVFLGVDTYSGYDFDWCEKDNALAYHNSGMGGGSPYVGPYCEPEKNPAKIWIKDGVKVRDAYGKNLDVSDAELIKMGYVRISEPIDFPAFGETTKNPFEHVLAEEGEAIYCSMCECFLLEVNTDKLCDHISWCSGCGCWTGKGSDEGECDCKNEEGGS